MSVELVKELMARTSTKTGLWVTVEIIKQASATGKKAPNGFKEQLTMAFDDRLPKWNYRAIPQRKSAK